MRACEERGLYYARGDDDAEARIAAARPWGVLDARDRDGLCGAAGTVPIFGHWGTARLAEVSARLDLPCAVLTSHARSRALPGASRLLVARAGPPYVPRDDAAPAARMLDALDADKAVTADEGSRWKFVYGSDLIDGVLDLLLDGARGPASFVPVEGMSEADFARALGFVAGADPDAVIATGDPIMFEPLPFAAMSYSPPSETTLERFVRERRAARRVSLVDAYWSGDEVELIAAE